MTRLGDINTYFIITEYSLYPSEPEGGKVEVMQYYTQSQEISIYSPRI